MHGSISNRKFSNYSKWRVKSISFSYCKNTDNKYESVRDRVLQYKEYLEEIGDIFFTVFKTAKKSQGKSKEVAILNERQAFFLMTLLRNNKKIVEFKFALTNAFFDMRDLLNQNECISKLSGRVRGLTKFNNILKDTNEKLVSEIEELKSQLLLTHKTFDDKFEVIIKQTENELNRDTKKHNFFRNRANYIVKYLKALT